MSNSMKQNGKKEKKLKKTKKIVAKLNI